MAGRSNSKQSSKLKRKHNKRNPIDAHEIHPWSSFLSTTPHTPQTGRQETDRQAGGQQQQPQQSRHVPLLRAGPAAGGGPAGRRRAQRRLRHWHQQWWHLCPGIRRCEPVGGAGGERCFLLLLLLLLQPTILLVVVLVVRRPMACVAQQRGQQLRSHVLTAPLAGGAYVDSIGWCVRGRGRATGIYVDPPATGRAHTKTTHTYIHIHTHTHN